MRGLETKRRAWGGDVSKRGRGRGEGCLKIQIPKYNTRVCAQTMKEGGKWGEGVHQKDREGEGAEATKGGAWAVMVLQVSY